MKNKMNKKIIYGITSSAAVFILGVGIIVGTNTFNNTNIPNQNYGIADLEQGNQNSGESLKIDLQINELKDIGLAKFDINVENINEDKLPEEYKFIENITVPQEFKLIETYKRYIRSNQDIKKYDLLRDYVFGYKKDDENSIQIAISTIGEPLRDYYIENNEKISTIGDINLKISQYKDMYIVSFKLENNYFDIETSGITENELVTLLESIITKSKTNNN